MEGAGGGAGKLAGTADEGAEGAVAEGDEDGEEAAVCDSGAAEEEVEEDEAAAVVAVDEARTAVGLRGSSGPAPSL